MVTWASCCWECFQNQHIHLWDFPSRSFKSPNLFLKKEGVDVGNTPGVGLGISREVPQWIYPLPQVSSFYQNQNLTHSHFQKVCLHIQDNKRPDKYFFNLWFCTIPILNFIWSFNLSLSNVHTCQLKYKSTFSSV